MECQYCQKIFANKYTLATHIKSAKSCVKIKTLDDDLEAYSCEHCPKKYTTKNRLTSHLISCKNFRACQTELYETKLKKYEDELKNKDCEIIKLKEELAFHKGQFSGFSKVKPANITNNQYIHPRLKNVPIENIEPFIQRTIDSRLSTYTYSHYKDHRRGVVEHLLSIATFRDANDMLNKSLACTNRSMNTFYALLEDKVWTKDLAVESIHKYLDSLRPLVEMYWPKFQKEQYAAIDEGDSDKVLINSKIYAKLLSFNPGVLEQHSHGFRKELVERIQAKIRNTLSV